MDRHTGIVWLFISAYFIFEVWRVKRNRRLRRVTDNGHPVRDAALLFVSGIILAGVLMIVIFLGNARLGEREMHSGPIHYALDLLLFMVAIG
jgi:sterol desaturase/sphingolipid hydroxylase (fatty acid hydroxylase superfamily)